MVTFDEKYFKDIWGTVHRHDYAHDLAQYLISKYGKVRFLDIGCGCGQLVLELRGQGADAWGLDISEYAVLNTCVPGYVLRGSVTDIPFKDGAFDVVHSQGLWEYLTEEEIKTAVAEVHRVGRQQEHNIDHDQTNPEPNYVTWRPIEWWRQQLLPPKILVACPNHQLKEYCFQRWIDNVKNFTYPNIEILVVDNTPDMDFYNTWKDKVPMIHIEVPYKSQEARINWSMEALRQHFLAGEYFCWFNVESDIIPPKDVIERMLPLAKTTDWLAHGYPDRNSDPDVEVMQGIGCCMFSKKLMQAYNFHSAGDNYTADGWLWNQVRPTNKFVTIEMWGAFKVRHLKE